jgi:hypothetical protein
MKPETVMARIDQWQKQRSDALEQMKRLADFVSALDVAIAGGRALLKEADRNPAEQDVSGGIA